MDPKLLGTRIREAREQLALSQEELSILVSKDQRAISEYENGKRKLAVTDLPAFAQALKVPLLYFFEGELEENDLDRAILGEFQQLPSMKAKQAAIEILRIFSETLYACVDKKVSLYDD